MFIIGATKKLQNELKQPLAQIEDHSDVPDIYQWHANLITINRRKCLILMNNETGLNLTLFGLRKKQFEHLESVVRGSLKQLLQVLDMDQQIIQEFLEPSEKIVFTKTSNRKVLGMMKELKFFVEGMTEGLPYEEIEAEEINKNNNEIIFSPLKYHSPKQTFEEFFK